MNSSIKYSNQFPGENEFFDLFDSTGWNEEYQLSSSELITAVRESWYWFSAYREKELVGFGRIICDGKVHALILDLIVAHKCWAYFQLNCKFVQKNK